MKQPLLRVRVGHHLAGCEDVTDVNIGAGQRTADKQASMAIERIGLRAHHGNQMLLSTRHETLQAGPKRFAGNHLLVIRHARCKHALLFGPPAELLPEKDVSDVLLRERSRQGVFVEMGREARAGRGANVGDGRYARFSQERGEPLNGVFRMPDGQYRVRLGHFVRAA